MKPSKEKKEEEGKRRKEKRMMAITVVIAQPILVIVSCPSHLRLEPRLESIYLRCLDMYGGIGYWID